jgi:hypothetical protein
LVKAIDDQSFFYLQQDLFPLAVTLYTAWLVVLFMALAVAADEYFCPATDVIARTCRYRQSRQHGGLL